MPLYHAYRVARVVREGSVGVTLVLDGALAAQPGQFVMAWLPGLDERPFSFMDDDPASLTVANVGPFSAALCALRPGERLWLRGPFGHGFELLGQRHLLLGGGSGAASLTLLAKRARSLEHQVVAVLGARSAGLLMLSWRFAELGCQVILATDDGSAGYRGTVLAAAAETYQVLARDPASGPVDSRPDSIYACGPEMMLRAVAERAVAAGVPCWVSMERLMRCGMGVCGSCHCGDQLVCVDGPAFSAQKLLSALCAE